jgi:adenine-specific DNA-methyltransferase
VTSGREQLEALSHEVGGKRTLLVCCGAFRVRPDAFENLTLKKIPNAILHRCEWGRDDYSLAVSQLQDDGEGATVELSTVGGA